MKKPRGPAVRGVDSKPGRSLERELHAEAREDRRLEGVRLAELRIQRQEVVRDGLRNEVVEVQLTGVELRFLVVAGVQRDSAAAGHGGNAVHDRALIEQVQHVHAEDDIATPADVERVLYEEVGLREHRRATLAVATQVADRIPARR